MTPTKDRPVLIIGAGISGLLLAQSLSRHAIPFRVFERDTDLETRGVGWGLTLLWTLPVLKDLLPKDLFDRLPEAYVDREAVAQGLSSSFPFFDLSTGELKASVPKAPEAERVRVTRQSLRALLATGIDIEVRCSAESSFNLLRLPDASGVKVLRESCRPMTLSLLHSRMEAQRLEVYSSHVMGATHECVAHSSLSGSFKTFRFEC
jgi:hypothetical protein